MNKLGYIIFLCLSITSGVHAQPQDRSADCTIYFSKSKKLKNVSIWSVKDSTIEYELDGSLHDVRLSEIHAIECGGRSYWVHNAALVSVEPRPAVPRGGFRHGPQVTSPEGMDMKTLGRMHADEVYKGSGALVASMLTAPTIVLPPMIAAIPPNNRKLAPDPDLYASDPEYRKSFNRRTHAKKAGSAMLGGTIGYILIMILLL